MTSRAPGATESYKPVCASLVEEFRQRRDLLDEVAKNADWTEEQRLSAALSMVETQLESLEQALWRAETELVEAERVVRELTEPKGKGNRRRPGRDDAKRLADRAQLLRHGAELDGKPLTPRDAVRAALLEMGRLDPNDPNGPVLDAAVLAYKRRYPPRR